MSDCWMVLTRHLDLDWKMHFPVIYSIQNFNTFWPSGRTMVGIPAKLKLVKFYKNFSRCNFEKLIRTLVCLKVLLDSLWLVWVWLPTLFTCDYLLVLSNCFKGDLMYNIFMSACFVLTISCLRAGLCGGWVSGSLWWSEGE